MTEHTQRDKGRLTDKQMDKKQEHRKTGSQEQTKINNIKQKHSSGISGSHSETTSAHQLDCLFSNDIVEQYLSTRLQTNFKNECGSKLNISG